MKTITAVHEVPRVGAVILDFFATWCSPCKTIGPAFEKLEAEFDRVSFFKVDIDKADAELQGQYSIRSVPTFVCLMNGKVVKKIEGADLRSIISVLEVLQEG